MAKVAELLIELRAGTATLTKDLAKGESQFRRSGEASAREVARTQQRIRQIIERGEPLLAARRAAMAELAVLREGQKEGLISAERYEAARTKILSDYLERRAQLRRREAREEATAPAAPSVASPESIFGAATANKTNIDDIYKKLTWAGERMEGVRSTMFALGVQTNSAADAMSMFASQMVKGAGKATLIGFALAGVTAGIAAIVQHVQEMQATERAIEAIGDAMGVTRTQVEQTQRIWSLHTDDLDKRTVVALMATGREAGLTAEQMQLLGRRAQQLANITGADFAAGFRQALSEIKWNASEAAKKVDEIVTAMQRRARGITPSADVEAVREARDSAKAALAAAEAEEERLRKETQAFKDARGARMDYAKFLKQLKEREEEVAAAAAVAAQRRAELAEFERQYRVASNIHGLQEERRLRMELAQAEAEEAQRRLEQQEREAKARAARLATERKRAREQHAETMAQVRDQSESRVRALKREGDAALAAAKLAKATPREIFEIRRYYAGQVQKLEEESREKEIREARDRELAIAAIIAKGDRRKELAAEQARAEEDFRRHAEELKLSEEDLQRGLLQIQIAYNKRRSELIEKESEERKRRAEALAREQERVGKSMLETFGDVRDWAQLGQTLMGAFMDGAMSETERRRKERNSKIGTIIGAIIGLGVGIAAGNPLAGAQIGSSAGATIGSMFADGGLVGGVGTDRSDSNLVRVSKGEYIVNARATRMALPLLEAINNGRVGAALPSFADSGLVGGGGMGGGGAAVIEYHDNRSFAAFDPRSMYEAAGVTLAPALYRRTANRADAKLTSIQQRALRAPRLGRSIG